MCGIVGCAAREDGTDQLLSGLGNLEYRGYDSAGIAVESDGDVQIIKREGDLAALRSAVDHRAVSGGTGVGHTRWSTHGQPDRTNAHPHVGCTGEVTVVHDGVVENHDELRRSLAARGHEFVSDTDSEVIPHLIEEYLADGADPEAAFRLAVGDIEGGYAVAAVVAGNDAVFAARDGSPLVLGRANDRHYLASDVPAFLEFTDRVAYLRDGDVATVGPDEVRITDGDGHPVDRQFETIDWDRSEVTKGRFDHYAEKEIHAQPDAIERAIGGRFGDETIALEGLPDGWLADVEEVHFLGCGTCYHAATHGARQLSRLGLAARPFRASEYATECPPVDDGTLAVAVTQSGETADTLAAVERARRDGARTLAATNVVDSSITRAVDESLYVRAGPEIGVAATKTFSSQSAVLTLLGRQIATEAAAGAPGDDLPELLDALDRLPAAVRSVLEDTRARWVAREYCNAEGVFFVGRDLGHPVALEGALKFKQITYEHAEGFAPGELKHGSLALVTSDTPVFAVFTGRNDRKTRIGAEEARARGAPVISVGPESVGDAGDVHLPVPETHPALTGPLANVVLQLVAYHRAVSLERSVDKPRNLARSVTVE